MDSQIIISIVVPIYKVESFIERCARSILEQINDRVEVIFVDDCSPDNSVQILQDIISRFPNAKCRIVAHEKNLGLAAARRTGVLNSVGQYIFHVDSDDYLYPGAIESFLNRLEQDNYPDIILGNYMNVYAHGQTPYKRQAIRDKTELISSIIERRQSCNIWNNLIRRNLYEGLEIPAINNGEDFVTLPRLLFKSDAISNNGDITYAYTHINTDAFQFKHKSRGNRDDKKFASEYLLNYFQEAGAQLRIIKSIRYSMLLNEAIDLIYATSLSEVKGVQVDSENFKENCAHLKFSYRIFLFMRIHEMNNILLISAIVARLFLK